jgi:hypothetical protein
MTYSYYHWQPTTITKETIVNIPKPTIWMPLVISKNSTDDKVFFTISSYLFTDQNKVPWLPITFTNNIFILEHPVLALKVIPAESSFVDILM